MSPADRLPRATRRRAHPLGGVRRPGTGGAARGMGGLGTGPSASDRGHRARAQVRDLAQAAAP